MNYKNYTIKLNNLSISYGFTHKQAGKFKKPDNVWSFLKSIYPGLSQINLMDQIHSANLSLIISNQKQIDVYKNSDALFYLNPKANRFLIIKTADCLPIVVWDAKGNLGIAHAGWRGSLDEILPKLLDYFLAQSLPEDIYIFIGPSIGFCCYPIHGPRLQQFTRRFPNWQDQIIIPDQDRLTLDLKRLNFLQSTKLGIPSSNINILSSCTSCQSDKFFSYAKEKTFKGNIITWLGLV
ncbi:MAG: polyphenol oxidase family protein [bacterium]|nr:polyphenol oxidase family protein [bacterium]